jgi:hypothetical protein
MTIKPSRIAALVLILFAGTVVAQSPDNSGMPSERGAARDGSRPSDGAIKGGSILPGENAGIPSDKAQNRCNDLTGSLREQCLAQERGVSTGGTRLPEADVAKPPPTRETPPPQNPR